MDPSGHYRATKDEKAHMWLRAHRKDDGLLLEPTMAESGMTTERERFEAADAMRDEFVRWQLNPPQVVAYDAVRKGEG